MKLKKLVVALAAMPFGIAAALTAPGSAPPYGNVSVNDTAAIDPYVYMFLLSSVSSLAHTLSSFPRTATSDNEGAIVCHNAARLYETQHDAGIFTPSTTPCNPTPHSAKYQAFAVIKLQQDVIPSNQQP